MMMQGLMRKMTVKTVRKMKMMMMKILRIVILMNQMMVKI